MRSMGATHRRWSDPAEPARWPSAVATGSGVISLVTGATVIVGWHTHQLGLIQIRRNWAPMQFNSAIGFACIGLAILALRFRLRVLTAAAAVIPLAIGLATMAEYVTSTPLRIDTLFMRPYVTTATSTPGRMAPNTAICLVLASAGLIVAGQGPGAIRTLLVGVAGSVTFAVASIALFGYASGAPNAYGWDNFTRMAAHSAVAFMIVGAALAALAFANSSDASKLVLWLPAPVGAVAFGCAVALWQLLIDGGGGQPKGTIDPDRATSAVLFVALFMAGLVTLVTTLGQAAERRRREADLAHGLLRDEAALRELAQNQLAVAHAELAVRAAELERSNTDLSRFAAVTAHDLCEPLRAISGFVQLLGDRYSGRLDPTADEYIGHTVEGVTRMRELLDDLLTYARLGGGVMTLTEVDLGDVLAEVTDAVASVVQATGATIETGDLPVVVGDRTQLIQLFQNLITNALKFRRPNLAPKVEVKAVRDRDGWQFSVSDNGIGIAERYRRRVFEVFERLHPREDYPGTGIGLAICKKAVEAHGGSIGVEASASGGSRFMFFLPDRQLYARPAPLVSELALDGR